MRYETLRRAVCEANRTLWKARLAPLTWGNVSAADADAGVLAIKPSGVPYEDLEPEMIPVVSIRDGTPVEGDLLPSSDTPAHRLLYRRFPGIGGIAHAHSPYATAWAQARRPIPCLGTTHADAFRGEIPVTRPLREAEIAADYEEETGKVIAELFEAPSAPDPMEMPAVLVASHGPFTWGRSAREAVVHAITLEEIARMAVLTFRIAHDTPPIPDVLLERHFTRKHGPGSYYGQRGETG